MTDNLLSIIGAITIAFYLILIPFSAAYVNSLRKLLLIFSFFALFWPYCLIIRSIIPDITIFFKIIKFNINNLFYSWNLTIYNNSAWNNGFYWGFFVCFYIASFLAFVILDKKHNVIRKDKCPTK